MSKDIIPLERIAGSIIHLRGHKVLLDFDLAGLYGIETRALKQAVRRNQSRFPADFMFESSADEMRTVVSQFVIPNRCTLLRGPLAERCSAFPDLLRSEKLAIIPVTLLMFAIGIVPQFVFKLFNIFNTTVVQMARMFA